MAVHGLLKRYERPFTPVAIGNPDGHEALGFDDLCLTGIDENGHLSPLPQLN
jgi:branched-chain amino acid transport system substrate-binding protein